jgi:hypothetical protein
MQTQGEELSSLRAEVASLKQLLTSTNARLAQCSMIIIACKDELINRSNELLATKESLLATKDELLASRAADLQRCTETPKCRMVTVASNAVTGTISNINQQRLHCSSTAAAQTPLDRDDILHHVFSLVGGGDHLYAGGVSRRWRGRYMQYCAQNSSCKLDGKLVTRHRSVVTTESRLQLALSCGLKVASWTFESVPQARLIYLHSLEPEKVMTLLRVLGAPWSTKLCAGAARYDKLALLQWLHSHSCAWDQGLVLHYATLHGSVSMLEWLLTVTPPWSSDLRRNMLNLAASDNRLAVLQWLRVHDTVWPYAFAFAANKRSCWTLSAVQWALACGSGWLAWQCEDYAPDKYKDAQDKQQATELLEWAHADGCPCTCGHVQQ